MELELKGAFLMLDDDAEGFAGAWRSVLAAQGPEQSGVGGGEVADWGMERGEGAISGVRLAGSGLAFHQKSRAGEHHMKAQALDPPLVWSAAAVSKLV